MTNAPLWQPLDERISLWVHSHASPALDQTMFAVTQIGNELPLILATFAFGLVLFLYYRRRQEVMLYLGAALTSFVMNGLIKRVVERPRPQLWQQIVSLPRDYSFPSGHAMISMTVYGLAAWLLAHHYPQWRKAILAVTGLLILSVGCSRIYLGVHWPSDVLAGFLCGLLIVAASGFWHHRSLGTQINVAQNK